MSIEYKKPKAKIYEHLRKLWAMPYTCTGVILADILDFYLIK